MSNTIFLQLSFFLKYNFSFQRSQGLINLFYFKRYLFLPYGKGWSLGGEGLRGLIKWNPKNLKIYQNKPFRLKVYPLFRFWPKFRQSNPFRHNRGRSKMSNFGFRLNRNRIQELVFGFGSGCFKSNFVCSLNHVRDLHSYFFS